MLIYNSAFFNRRLGEPMHFSSETIVTILSVGTAFGLLLGALAKRTAVRIIGGVGVGIISVSLAGWLILAWRDFVVPTIDLPTPTTTKNDTADLMPPFEIGVLPRAPLHFLLKPSIPRSREEICDTVVMAAQKNDLPAPFFIRLLYQESNFRPGAISPAGALGIAQFMGETATDRGLENPFDPLQAIPASARLLRDLQRKFGNLGLAAAAYNAGPKRVTDWLASKGPLPQETQNYVMAITGRPAERWNATQSGSPAVKLQQDAPCQDAAGLLAWNGPDQIPLPPRKPRAKNTPGDLVIAQEPKRPHAKSSAK
jgi:hypothetical protein